MKIILNKNNEHYLTGQDINYNITYQIQNYSTHSSSINCHMENNSAENLSYFEDTPITSIDIYNSQDTLITSFTFNDNNLYILNINTVISEENITSFVNFGTIKTITKQEE